jgi:hypothetical protein
MKVFLMSGRASRRMATSGGGLERETAAGEQEFGRNRDGNKRKIYPRMRRSLAKLLGTTSAMIGFRAGEIESGCVRACETVSERGEGESSTVSFIGEE